MRQSIAFNELFAEFSSGVKSLGIVSSANALSVYEDSRHLNRGQNNIRDIANKLYLKWTDRWSAGYFLQIWLNMRTIVSFLDLNDNVLVGSDLVFGQNVLSFGTIRTIRLREDDHFLRLDQRIDITLDWLRDLHWLWRQYSH